ncbi:MAG: ferredoxin [Caldisphaeraceae archaeon]|nr:ferredoxin [Caldisphaeraceae archaeon]MEB2793042.1 ferredoxin [Caldisphaeraceae archaeon]MEB3691769.1 ferredoxin [Caldisphaeraceae archaeon]MEB3797826.1 ferredoxin [Caldisphaeraceae archaeon]
MTLRVTIDPRDNCIADMVCVSLCGDVFEMADDDGKSQIIAKWRKDPDNRAEGFVPDDLKDCVDSAAQSCPTQIIHVEPA